MKSAALLCLFAFSQSAALPAQAKIPLGKPDAESSEGFTNITSIRELPNGKVLVADLNDKVVQLIDFSAGTMTRVGREGKGPGEYSMPSALLGLPDGTTLLNDLLNRRFLVIGPDGKPGDVADLPPTQSAGPGGGITLGGAMRVDARGRLFLQGTPFSRETGTQLDSVAVIRWDRNSPKLDTVAWFKPAAGNTSVNRSGGGTNFRIGGGKVFTPADAWTVTGDGRVARVMPAPYRVVWYDASTRVTAGPVQPYSPIKVGEAEKEQVREQRKKQKPVVITFGGGGGAPPPNIQLPEPEFEETMPPFNSAGVFGTPDGEVWVLRNRPASDKIPAYDVFDRAGALIKKVVLEPNSRVVGFGKGIVYVAHSDEDDLQFLQRFRKP